MNTKSLRAAGVVAAVYGYFLIFAQFSFVELLRGGGVSVGLEKTALGLMAVSGVAAGFAVAWRGARPAAVRRALLVAAVVAGVSGWMRPMPWAAGLVVAVVTGASLGVATVSLAALLRGWCSMVWVGVGTGLGYAYCNLPWVFSQDPSGQAWAGAIVAMAAIPLVPEEGGWERETSQRVFPFWGAVAVFTALVWLDSAAFFIIQHVGDFKEGTWSDGMLWRNAAVHLGVACVAGGWLKRGGARQLPAFAWILLAVAALAVNRQEWRVLGGWLYPAGVSLYSAALVVWPGWFAGAVDEKQAARRAAWMFAIAGWFGSANGIGMAETLREVPAGFVVAAGAVVLGVMIFARRADWRTPVLVGAVVCGALWAMPGDVGKPGSAAERGRQVYLSEGCIHCHSQYVRPGTRDEQDWGPVKPMAEVMAGRPVTIGNRRQGPDLSQVGARRSEAWLTIHVKDPRALVAGSAMPSYAHLFEDGRGQDLVKYLKACGESKVSDVMANASAWEPAGVRARADGKRLFSLHCAVCHGMNGLGNGPLSLELVRKPANLVAGPFVWTPASADLEKRVAQVIKYGIPVTDMPGHEALEDEAILALRDHVLGLRKR